MGILKPEDFANEPQNFELLLETASDGIHILDTDGNLIKSNKAFRDSLGYTLEESQTLNVRDWDAQFSLEEVERKLGELFQKPGLFTTKHRRKNGSIIEVEINTRMVEIGGNKYLYNSSRDITERKQAERTCAASLHFFESMERVNEAIHGKNDLEAMLNDLLETSLSIFDCDRAWLQFPCDPEAPFVRIPVERTRPRYPGANVQGMDIPTTPEMAGTFRKVLEDPSPLCCGPGSAEPIPLSPEVTEKFSIRSIIEMAVHPKLGKPWMFGLHQCSYPRVWTEDDQRLFQEIGLKLADGLTGLLAYRNLKESEEKYRRIVDTTREGIWALGPDGKTTLVNTRMAKMLGCQVEELNDRLLTDFMFIEDLPDHFNKMENRRRDISESYERRLRRKDGETIWTLVSATPVFDQERHFMGSFGMFTDITERKKSEEELIKSDKQFKGVMRFAKVGGWEYDVKKQTMFWTDELYRIHGIVKEEIPPGSVEEHIRRAVECYAPESRPVVLSAFNRCVKDGTPFELESPFTSATGRKMWVRTAGDPIYENGEIVKVGGPMMDITAEMEVRNLNIELEERVKMRTAALDASNKELEAFSYSVSHDLHSPLRTLDGFSAALLDDYGNVLDERGKDYLRRIRRGTARMAGIIDDILKLSRITRAEISREDINLSSIAEAVAHVLKDRDPARDTAFAISTTRKVSGDARLMRIALENLLGNAWKYTGKKQGATIEFGETRVDGQPVFFVRDNGAGFDPSQKDVLFLPFRRLHPADEFEGAGIGLATVKRVITRHGGRIWAEGQVGKGAVFYFTI